MVVTSASRTCFQCTIATEDRQKSAELASVNFATSDIFFLEQNYPRFTGRAETSKERCVVSVSPSILRDVSPLGMMINDMFMENFLNLVE